MRVFMRKLHIGFRSLSFIFLINVGIAQGMEAETVHFLYESISSTFSLLMEKTNNNICVQLNEQTNQISLLTIPNEILETIVKRTSKDDFYNATKLFIQLSLVCKQFKCLSAPDKIKTLLNPDQKTLDHTLSLYTVFKDTHPSFHKLILAMGANVNYQDDLGLTALHGAIQLNRPDVMKVLLENKANMYLTNKYGYTPAYTTMLSNKPECLKILIEHGLDTSIVYVFDVVHQKTIAEWAKKWGHHEI